jgi:hypothetical protein
MTGGGTSDGAGSSAGAGTSGGAVPVVEELCAKADPITNSDAEMASTSATAPRITDLPDRNDTSQPRWLANEMTAIGARVNQRSVTALASPTLTLVPGHLT